MARVLELLFDMKNSSPYHSASIHEYPTSEVETGIFDTLECDSDQARSHFSGPRPISRLKWLIRQKNYIHGLRSHWKGTWTVPVVKGGSDGLVSKVV